MSYSNDCGFNTSIIFIANDFYEAYNRCKEEKNKRMLNDGRICSDIVNIPALVNGFFACELYLKSILKKNIKVHELYNLFLLLDQHYQIMIKDYCDKTVCYSNYCFEKDLQDFSDSFKFWRYIHEQNDNYEKSRFYKSLIFLESFVKILKTIANNKESI